MSLYEHVAHEHQPVNVNVAHAAERTGFNQKLAVVITKGFGSIYAFYALIAWMVIWMVLASLGFWLFKKDSYPFPFLLFCSNLVQLWALPVLAVGTSVLGRKQELQSEEQYQFTLKSYHDIEQMMKHLDAQDAVLIQQTALIQEQDTKITQLLSKPVTARKKAEVKE